MLLSHVPVEQPQLREGCPTNTARVGLQLRRASHSLLHRLSPELQPLLRQGLRLSFQPPLHRRAGPDLRGGGVGRGGGGGGSGNGSDVVRVALVHVAAEGAQLRVGSSAHAAQVLHGLERSLNLAAAASRWRLTLTLPLRARAPLGVPAPHVVSQGALEGEGHPAEGAGVDLRPAPGPGLLLRPGGLRRQRAKASGLLRVLAGHVVVQGQHGGEGEAAGAADLAPRLEGPPHAAAAALLVALEGVHGGQALAAQLADKVAARLHALVLVGHVLLQGVHAAVGGAAQLAQHALQFEVHTAHVLGQLALDGEGGRAVGALGRAEARVRVAQVGRDLAVLVEVGRAHLAHVRLHAA